MNTISYIEFCIDSRCTGSIHANANFLLSLSLQTISGKLSLDLVKLVQDSRVLPCPQDLRYAVFALGASQNAAESVRNHLPELRKSCIVRILGPLQFELGMPNSITAVIAVHDCYPEVMPCHIVIYYFILLSRR